MSQIYRGVSKTNGQVVKLYECHIKKGFTHAIFVNNREYAYLDNLNEAYRLYNDLLR